MKQSKYKKGDWLQADVMIKGYGTMPVEPSTGSNDAGYADRCRIERCKCQILNIRMIQIDDKEPEYQYYVQFSYRRICGFVDDYLYTAWIEEGYLFKNKEEP